MTYLCFIFFEEAWRVGEVWLMFIISPVNSVACQVAIVSKQ